MLKAHPAIDQNQTMYVRFINYGDYTLDIQIYTFTKTTDWVAFMEIQEDVLLKVGEIVTEHGAEIAFPTQTIEVPKDVNIKKVSDEQTSGMH
jgi:MscS family membrane protein